MCIDFLKMAPKIKVQTFFLLEVIFLVYSGKLGEICAKMVLDVLRFE